MDNLCVEAAYMSFNKHGEQLCGDRVEIADGADDSKILVLADGLGSGVKANILSTLTSKIVSTMLAGGIPIDDCVETIASTLPVCQVRKIAYSTFSVIKITENTTAELTQYDNPETIVLRDGKRWDYPFTTRTIANKTIREAKFSVQQNDLIIAMSDGATFAGLGVELNYGWQRDNIIEFAEQHYDESYSAKYMADCIAGACNQLYAGEPGDDTTVAVVRIRKRQPVNLVIGPPSTKDQDLKMMNLFFAKEGYKIVCGGTTANIAGRYLGKPVVPSLDYYDPDIPPTSTIAGVDLVTEGVVTISRVLKIGEGILDGTGLSPNLADYEDGASKVAHQLFDEATDINFFVGKAINPAHQNPNLPITFGIKIQLIDSLAQCLEKMGKRIKVSYF